MTTDLFRPNSWMKAVSGASETDECVKDLLMLRKRNAFLYRDICRSAIYNSPQWTWPDDNNMYSLVDRLLVEWTKCGETVLSMVPTILWAIGSAALAHRLITAIFKRFMFRRVPLWEIILQYLLYIWMVIYSLHLWTLVVKVVKIFIEYCYEMEETYPTTEDIEKCKMMQQWMIWMCGVTPLALFIHMRPKAVGPPLMIWITTNPWHRREMGPYGYYLNRPLQIQEVNTSSIRHQTLKLRRAFSDTNAIVKEQPKKRRTSKSI